jgi:hypothetical protein
MPRPLARELTLATGSITTAGTSVLASLVRRTLVNDRRH